jgi:hypothetical protein
LHAICDLAYAIQVEQIERQTLTEMTLAPHLEDASGLLTPEAAIDEFNRFLAEPPAASAEEIERSEVRELIRGGG